jgi:hypothetical protein
LPITFVGPNRRSNSSELDFVNWSISQTHRFPHRQVTMAVRRKLALPMFADCRQQNIRFWGQSGTVRILREESRASPVPRRTSHRCGTSGQPTRNAERGDQWRLGKYTVDVVASEQRT